MTLAVALGDYGSTLGTALPDGDVLDGALVTISGTTTSVCYLAATVQLNYQPTTRTRWTLIIETSAVDQYSYLALRSAMYSVIGNRSCYGVQVLHSVTYTGWHWATHLN